MRNALFPGNILIVYQMDYKKKIIIHKCHVRLFFNSAADLMRVDCVYVWEEKKNIVAKIVSFREKLNFSHLAICYLLYSVIFQLFYDDLTIQYIFPTISNRCLFKTFYSFVNSGCKPYLFAWSLESLGRSLRTRNVTAG